MEVKVDELLGDKEDLEKMVTALANEREDLRKANESLQEEADRAKELDEVRDQVRLSYHEASPCSCEIPSIHPMNTSHTYSFTKLYDQISISISL